MNYESISNHYYILYREPLPFQEYEVDWERTDEEQIDRAAMLQNVRTKYDTYLAAHGSGMHADYAHFFSAIGDCNDTILTCLFLYAKGHLLLFIFDRRGSQLLCVFPLKKWQQLVGHQY